MVAKAAGQKLFTRRSKEMMLAKRSVATPSGFVPPASAALHHKSKELLEKSKPISKTLLG